MQIEAVAQIVSSYLKKNHVRANELPDLIAETHKALAGLGAAEAEPQPKALVAPMSVRRAVQLDHIVSFEDSKPYKSLKRHASGRDTFRAPCSSGVSSGEDGEDQFERALCLRNM